MNSFQTESACVIRAAVNLSPYRASPRCWQSWLIVHKLAWVIMQDIIDCFLSMSGVNFEGMNSLKLLKSLQRWLKCRFLSSFFPPFTAKEAESPRQSISWHCFQVFRASSLRVYWVPGQVSDEHFAVFYCVSPSSGHGWASQGHNSFQRLKEGLSRPPVTLPGNLLRVFLYRMSVIHCIRKS